MASVPVNPTTACGFKNVFVAMKATDIEPGDVSPVGTMTLAPRGSDTEVMSTMAAGGVSIDSRVAVTFTPRNATTAP